MIEWLFSWEVTSFAVSLAIAIGLAVLALSDYRLAKLFFLIAAADATGGVLMGAHKSGLPHWATAVIVFFVVGGIGLLTLLAFWYVDKKRTPTTLASTATAKLGFASTASIADYPGGTSIAGIAWSRRFTNIRLIVGNSSDLDIQDIDISLLPDRPIAAIGQVGNIPGVTFTPTVDLSMGLEVLKRGTGQRIANPLVLVATEGGYRLRCGTLPRRSMLEVVIAIARVIDFPAQGAIPKGDVFSRDYVLRIGTPTVGHWYAHGLFDEIYKPEKVMPHFIKVEGTYSVSGNQVVTSDNVEVKDVVGEVIKRL